jgi:hypothetical protein
MRPTSCNMIINDAQGRITPYRKTRFCLDDKVWEAKMCKYSKRELMQSRSIDKADRGPQGGKVDWLIGVFSAKARELMEAELPFTRDVSNTTVTSFAAAQTNNPAA